jgi:N-acetylglucosamine malate deacetylase 1
MKNILVIVAHPDDETLGCGATIKKLTEEGNYVKLITFTDGEGARENNEDRTSIIKDVCQYLGINDFVCGNFPDNKMDSVPLLDLVKFIEKNVDFQPDIIYTHWEHCNNVDHALVYKATITAFRPQNGKNIKIYSFFVPSSSDYNPTYYFNGNIYENVENFYNYKKECLLNFYKNELREYPHTRSIENIENLMKVWGSEVGLRYAEKFILVRSIQ